MCLLTKSHTHTRTYSTAWMLTLPFKRNLPKVTFYSLLEKKYLIFFNGRLSLENTAKTKLLLLNAEWATVHSQWLPANDVCPTGLLNYSANGGY